MSRLLIQFSHLCKSFGNAHILQDVSLSVHEGDLIALIGENGAGKSTLLKIVEGVLKEDAGHVKRVTPLRVGILPQEIPVLATKVSVREYLEDAELLRFEREMEKCLEDPNRLEEWETLHEQYELQGGYCRLPVVKVLSGLKLDCRLLDLPMSELSGGEKVRMALAKALTQNPDILLLDEPTNHLDDEMLVWLEKMLISRVGATIIASHHRSFLNRVCHSLVELKEGKLALYAGNYDFYLSEKQAELERQMRIYEEQEEERKCIKKQIKAMTFSCPKPAKPKDRNIMAYDRHGESYQKSKQQRLNVLKGRLETLENQAISHPRPKSITGLRFLAAPFHHDQAIEIANLSHDYEGKSLYEQFSMIFAFGERVILTGANGSGKTTLLRLILGELEPKQGKVYVSSQASVGYLDQEVKNLPLNQTPLEFFAVRFQLTEESLRKELHKAALKRELLLNRPFSSMSVGERKRFMLLTLMLSKPNVLLLDEPTNHLDLLTLEAFEEALLSFTGLIIAVSHDPTFISKLEARKISVEIG
ncbi:ribosomal protection-like ABC-F family protein [Simkania sp.]|uniref:ribosomal protection-like ABC-F family protein n=1 Tax=Simkania sp. TaxID=34094 RepID=UPI003B523D70